MPDMLSTLTNTEVTAYVPPTPAGLAVGPREFEKNLDVFMQLISAVIDFGKDNLPELAKARRALCKSSLNAMLLTGTYFVTKNLAILASKRYCDSKH